MLVRLDTIPDYAAYDPFDPRYHVRSLLTNHVVDKTYLEAM